MMCPVYFLLVDLNIRECCICKINNGPMSQHMTQRVLHLSIRVVLPFFLIYLYRDYGWPIFCYWRDAMKDEFVGLREITKIISTSLSNTLLVKATFLLSLSSLATIKIEFVFLYSSRSSVSLGLVRFLSALCFDIFREQPFVF